MSLMSSKEQNEHDLELENMLKEIQKSLSTHLTNILTPIFNEKKDIHNILLNVPMIKKMHIENIELKSTNKLLSDEIDELKKELSKYENVKLQVKELDNSESKTLTIENDTNRKNQKMKDETKTIKLVDDDSLNYFKNMVSEDESDDEKYENNTSNSNMWLNSLVEQQNKENDLFLGSDDKGDWEGNKLKNSKSLEEEDEEAVDTSEEIVAEEDDEEEEEGDDDEEEVVEGMMMKK